MKTYEMNEKVRNAIRNMPMHWDDDRQRTTYMIDNAELFRVSYTTTKTRISEDFLDLETAKRVAKFTAAVGSRLGRLGKSGIAVKAVVGSYDALVKAYYGDEYQVASSEALPSNGSNSSG